MSTIGEIFRRVSNASVELFKEKPIIRKETSNIVSDKRGTRGGDKKTYLIGRLSAQTCREMALRCPLFMKGAYKKNGDIFNNWFEIVDKDGNALGTQGQNIIDEFDDRVNIKAKMFTAGICNDVYGDLYLERTFMRKDGGKYIPVVSDAKVQPNLNDEPLNINVINPESIYKIGKLMGSTSEQEYYYYKEKTGGEKHIHPDRIIHDAEIRLPYSKFGVSKVDIGYNIINSLMNTDEISGEILDWFSTGMYVARKAGIQPDEQDRAIEQFNQHPRYLVLDSEYEIDVYNPTRIDPEPFYEHYYTKVAALFRMPRQLLIGAEVGAITGSEVGFADYVASIHQLREMYGNILTTIYKHLFKTQQKDWKYKLIWNKTYIDELSESKTMEKRALVATALVDRKIITREESRRVMNEGFVRLNIYTPDGEFLEPNPNAQQITPNVPYPKGSKPKKKPKDYGKDGEGKQEPKKAKQKNIFDMTSGEIEERLQDKRMRKI